MKDIVLTVRKESVYDEVAKTTAYVGHKLQGEENGYNRIFTKDSDQDLLDRFWQETCNAVTDQLKPYITQVQLSEDYDATISVPDAFDDTIKDSMESSLFSFFVTAIVGKWFRITNRSEVDTYLEEAVGYMNDVVRKLYHRTRPDRPSYNDVAI